MRAVLAPLRRILAKYQYSGRPIWSSRSPKERSQNWCKDAGRPRVLCNVSNSAIYAEIAVCAIKPKSESTSRRFARLPGFFDTAAGGRYYAPVEFEVVRNCGRQDVAGFYRL